MPASLHPPMSCILRDQMHPAIQQMQPTILQIRQLWLSILMPPHLQLMPQLVSPMNRLCMVSNLRQSIPS